MLDKAGYTVRLREELADLRNEVNRLGDRLACDSITRALVAFDRRDWRACDAALATTVERIDQVGEGGAEPMEPRLGDCDGCRSYRLVYPYRGLWLCKHGPERCWRRRKRLDDERAYQRARRNRGGSRNDGRRDVDAHLAEGAGRLG